MYYLFFSLNVSHKFDYYTFLETRRLEHFAVVSGRRYTVSSTREPKLVKEKVTFYKYHH